MGIKRGLRLDSAPAPAQTPAGGAKEKRKASPVSVQVCPVGGGRVHVRGVDTAKAHPGRT